jgi:hypothetical protein
MEEQLSESVHDRPMTWGLPVTFENKSYFTHWRKKVMKKKSFNTN